MTNEELVHRIGRRVKRKGSGDVLTIWGIRMWGSTLRADTRDEEGMEWSVAADEVDPHYEPLTEEQAKELKPGQKLQVIATLDYVYFSEVRNTLILVSRKPGGSVTGTYYSVQLELIPYS